MKGKLVRSHSVLVCLRFRIRRYVAAPGKQIKEGLGKKGKVYKGSWEDVEKRGRKGLIEKLRGKGRVENEF